MSIFSLKGTVPKEVAAPDSTISPKSSFSHFLRKITHTRPEDKERRRKIYAEADAAYRRDKLRQQKNWAAHIDYLKSNIRNSNF